MARFGKAGQARLDWFSFGSTGHGSARFGR